MKKTFLQPLKEYAKYLEIKEAIDNGVSPIAVTGTIEGQNCHFMQALAGDLPYRVIIAAEDAWARRLAEEYREYDENVYYYPARDFIFSQADIRSKNLVRERMAVIRRLVAGLPTTVVTTIDAGMDLRLPVSSIKNAVICLKTGESVETSLLEKKLIMLGYDRVVQVEAEGEFSVRGGIIDIFPMCEDAPVRIELFGDEIDTMRVFDAESQRSIENVEEICVYPATENVFTGDELAAGLKKIKTEAEKQYKKYREAFATEAAARIKKTVTELEENIGYLYYTVNLDSYLLSFTKETVSFFDYFPADSTVFFMVDPDRIRERAEAVGDEYALAMQQRLTGGYVLPSQIKTVTDGKKTESLLRSKRLVYLPGVIASAGIKTAASFEINVTPIGSYRGDLTLLIKDVKAYAKKKYRVVIVSASGKRARRVADTLRDYDLNAYYSSKNDAVAAGGEVMVVEGRLTKGYVYPLINFAVISETDIFGERKRSVKKKKETDASHYTRLNSLHPGDYVIHENYGLGVYRGLTKLEVDGVLKEYINIEYSGKSCIYVPLTSMDMVQKHSDGGTENPPKLAKLGTQDWKQTKSKVKASVNEIAEELVELYAKRQAASGYKFSPDTVWQNEFEELFPFEETGDQLRAIEETKADMESEKVMDRLICGDVGYGKTEIALRAAFKAVQDSKQVAILVPTTILAKQHYDTFVQRFMNFPVKVALMCRFRTQAEIRETVKELKNGEVDIVIGTHRLLSKDVEFKSLGLLIIDEEQRFGVTHKEKLKRLRNNVDVLTLTATPIPRTLHMSLSGIRDMSVLDEPPVDRMPIQTYVMEQNDQMIREAVNRELSRGGQVYYVHNRIMDIAEVHARLENMLPEARIGVAHGRMGERELEKIVMSFIAGELDVLVSTTIIETGIDIPNVNTIIIDDADRFGLAQLYQLRGRVGRSGRTAYAFLMYRRNRVIKEEAEKRLDAIRQFTELGSGHKIAMKDLEIRGAGNLLGERQSGHMSMVGYDLYCRMLSEAVLRLKGEEIREEFETTVDIDADAFIPASYIRSETVRLEMYKKIASISGDDDADEVAAALKDRFGRVPAAAGLLIQCALMRSKAHEVYIEELVIKKDRASLKFVKDAALNAEKIPGFIRGYKGRCRVVTGAAPEFIFALKEELPLKKVEEVNEILTHMKDLLIAAGTEE